MANELAKPAVTREQLIRPAGDAATVRDLLTRMRGQLDAALPKHISADRLIRVAMTAIQSKPKLLECTAGSLLACIMESSSLGLELGPLGHAYLVPFKDSRTKAVICTLIPGYKGLMDLARRSGQIATLDANVVHDGDTFDFCYGSSPFLSHKPSMGERGKPIYAYAYASLIPQGFQFRALTLADIADARRRSKSANEGPWVTDWDAMAMKTAVRRLAKFLPMSVEYRQLAAIEDAVELGMRQPLAAMEILNLPEEVLGSGDREIEAEPEIQAPKAKLKDG